MTGIPKEAPADVIGAPKDDWDPMQSSDKAILHWTTTNLGEGLHGIITPLGTALWPPLTSTAALRSTHRIGVLSRRELALPDDAAQWTVRAFYGRLAMQLEYMATLGDRMPGITGEEAMVSLFGKPPEGMVFANTARRYPVIAVRLPWTFITVPRMLARVCAANDRWWRAKVEAVPSLDLPASISAFSESIPRFQAAMDMQGASLLASTQPLFDLLERLIERAGAGDTAVLSGTGGAEIAVVTDIWRASRGEATVADVVRSHGFHGPNEGEVSSTVWREDPAPLHTVVEHYRRLSDSESPARREAEKERRRVAMTRELLSALPRHQRPAARLVLALARRRIPDRGRAKRAFLQAIDVARMSARRAGEHLAAAGVISERDDVFYLTGDELAGEIPAGVKDLVARRRQRRGVYEKIGFSSTEWAGMPDAVEIERLASPPVDASDNGRIEGTGASSGVVEGRVRVVEDPSFHDVEPNEILVAPTTDPSWSSIMYVSAALVVDLGGKLSHAAVVARELEIPCVVNTRDGTKRLNTGDLVRVDGRAGTVEILERAA